MALVNDDVGEVVGRIKLGKERFVAVLLVNAESLVRGDMNRGVACMVLAAGIAINFAYGIAEVIG